MSVSDGFGMKLPLRAAASDLNGNAFPVSSSSSSSSSSPESLRGLSGADSPPDYDMLEVTLTTVMATADAVVISKWLPQEDTPEDDVSAGKTESNDNSVSVYLDADEFRRDAWNDNLTLSLTTSSGSHGNDDPSTPDSDATEIPADDDDDEDEDEEALFLSVSSDINLTLNPELACPPVLPDDTQTEPPASEDLSESTQVTLPVARSKSAATRTKPSGVNSGQRVSKPDLKTARTNVGSRSNQSPPKTPSQIRAAPVNTRRAASRKEEAADGGKRPTAGPVRVAVVLRPIRAKSHKPEEQRRLSASSSSLGSEASPGRAVRQNREDGAPLTDMEKPRSRVRKVSSKPGPGARQQQQPPGRVAPPPGLGTGPPGRGSPGPRPAQTEGSSAGEGGQSAGSGSPSKLRPSPSQGIPKPRTSSFTASKPAANQQPASASSGRPAAPASSSSKLPVKGLPTSLSASSLGSNENGGAASRADPSPHGAPGTRPEDRPSRSSAKPPGCSSTDGPSAPSAPSDATSGAMKLPAMRSRALSLQARSSATGLKPPAVSAHGATKPAAPMAPRTPAAGQNQSRPTQNPLQRSGSARLGRPSSLVDKNKPAARSSGGSQTAEKNQNQQLPPPEQVPDVVNANTPAAPVLPVPATDNATSGSTGPSGFRARTGLRSSPKAASRLQNATRAAGGAAPVDGSAAAKQNQNKEQAEKKNQAISQLRKLLLQGNRRVEALATVIQHLFTEREEALKQKKELSLELSNLRDELASSSQCCERLQKEKEEVRLGLEEALRRLEEQHKEELVQLEDRCAAHLSAHFCLL
uniref:Uncharacterized protein n=1 Tax=Stegastes partitus TaxID=144197 RepID=A0A3B4ZDG4_9TELE